MSAVRSRVHGNSSQALIAQPATYGSAQRRSKTCGSGAPASALRAKPANRPPALRHGFKDVPHASDGARRSRRWNSPRTFSRRRDFADAARRLIDGHGDKMRDDGARMPHARPAACRRRRHRTMKRRYASVTSDRWTPAPCRRSGAPAAALICASSMLIRAAFAGVDARASACGEDGRVRQPCSQPPRRCRQHHAIDLDADAAVTLCCRAAPDAKWQCVRRSAARRWRDSHTVQAGKRRCLAQRAGGLMRALREAIDSAAMPAPRHEMPNAATVRRQARCSPRSLFCASKWRVYALRR